MIPAWTLLVASGASISAGFGASWALYRRRLAEARASIHADQRQTGFAVRRAADKTAEAAAAGRIAHAALRLASVRVAADGTLMAVAGSDLPPRDLHLPLVGSLLVSTDATPAPVPDPITGEVLPHPIAERSGEHPVLGGPTPEHRYQWPVWAGRHPLVHRPWRPSTHTWWQPLRQAGVYVIGAVRAGADLAARYAVATVDLLADLLTGQPGDHSRRTATIPVTHLILTRPVGAHRAPRTWNR